MENVIYKIENTSSLEIYIGSAVVYNRRVKQHLWHLKHNKHHNQILQNIFNKYGESIFKFSIVEQCTSENLIEREQYYINLLNPKYNICKTAGSILGIKRSDETKLKMSNSRANYKITEETKRKISTTLKGRKKVLHITEEKKQELYKSISLRQKGKKLKNLNYDKHLSKLHNIVKRNTILTHKETGEILFFKSRKEAAIFLGINERRVSDFLYLKKKNTTNYNITKED